MRGGKLSVYGIVAGVVAMLFGSLGLATGIDEIEQENAAVLRDCKGKHKNTTLDAAHLKRVIAQHKIWRRVYETQYETKAARSDARRAVLCGANLSGANLAWADLRDADLRGANFNRVNLSWADLRDTDLRAADFSGANMSKASLRYANLIGATFHSANLNGANLMGANLSVADMRGAKLQEAGLGYAILKGVDLAEADLSGAYLSGTNMRGANLRAANLHGTIYEPSEIPRVETMADATNLEYMSYGKNPQALKKLRTAFHAGGFRLQAGAVTYALNHSALWRGETYAETAESALKYAFFEVPTRWGMYPGRALYALLVQWGVFWWLYYIALRYPGAGRIQHQSEAQAATPTNTSRNALLASLQFSLQSVLHIGFRDYTVGRWLMRCLTRNNPPYAVGWVRLAVFLQVVSGTLLFALWAVTFFGQAFE
ncbi:MAG: pentapeptide repeat-containing protein [Pseudomonadota bacterium]